MYQFDMIRYGFSKAQRGGNDIKNVYIANFSQFRSRGGHQKSIFSQIQKTPKHPGCGGPKKSWTFSTSLDYFVDLFKVISDTYFNSFWHLLKISPILIILATSFPYFGYLLKFLAPLINVGTFYIIFVIVRRVAGVGTVSGGQ